VQGKQIYLCGGSISRADHCKRCGSVETAVRCRCQWERSTWPTILSSTG
jgi:hypothetical protein